MIARTGVTPIDKGRKKSRYAKADKNAPPLAAHIHSTKNVSKVTPIVA
jgi:hypothetical protein